MNPHDKIVYEMENYDRRKTDQDKRKKLLSSFG
jgi:hypothetical protein